MSKEKEKVVVKHELTYKEAIGQQSVLAVGLSLLCGYSINVKTDLSIGPLRNELKRIGDEFKDAVTKIKERVEIKLFPIEEDEKDSTDEKTNRDVEQKVLLNAEMKELLDQPVIIESPIIEIKITDLDEAQRRERLREERATEKKPYTARTFNPNILAELSGFVRFIGE